MSILNKLASFFNRRDKGDLKLFTEVVDEKLKVLGHDISLLELEYNLRTASGEWLDEWGSWFGVYRGMDEGDDEYRYRILTSLARATGTIPAILASVLEYYEVEYGKGKYTEEDIQILEPYTLLKKFSECGDFSGTHRFQDGTYYRHHVLEITVPESVTPELRQMVDKTKAGGIKVYYNVSQSSRPNEDGSSGIVSMTPSDNPIPDVCIKSDLEHAVIKYGARHSKYVPLMHRSRSGKKILDVIETFIAMDFGFIKGHTYKDISEFWKVMCEYNHTTPVWVPKTDNGVNELSVSIGARSGDRDGHWEYHPVEEVFKDTEDNVLQLPVVHTHAYIKPARRSRCGNGHSLGYPRSGLEGEDFDYTQKEYVDNTQHVDAYWRMVDWADTTVITTIEVELEKPPTILVDKFFVTEHAQDEQQFNILSQTVEFTDAPYFSDVLSYNDVASIEVQSTTQPTYIKTMMNVEDISLLNVDNDTTYYTEMIVRRDANVITESGEEILIIGDANLLVGGFPYDTTTVESLVITEHILDELEFNTVSPSITFEDAGTYGSDTTFEDVQNLVQIQSSTSVIDLPISNE